MAKLGDLLGLLAFRNVGKQTQLIHQLLSGMAVVLALTIISGLLIGALLVGSLYAFYYVLMSYGLEQNAALWVTAGLAVVLTGLFIMLTIAHLRKIMEIPYHIFEARAPIAAKTSGVLNSFVDGLMGDTDTRHSA